MSISVPNLEVLELFSIYTSIILNEMKLDVLMLLKVTLEMILNIILIM